MAMLNSQRVTRNRLPSDPRWSFGGGSVPEHLRPIRNAFWVKEMVSEWSMSYYLWYGYHGYYMGNYYIYIYEIVIIWLLLIWLLYGYYMGIYGRVSKKWDRNSGINGNRMVHNSNIAVISGNIEGFHSHGGTPIAGWFIRENPNLKWMMTGVPLFKETSMWKL